MKGILKKMTGLEYERAVIGAIMMSDQDGDNVGVYYYKNGWSLISEILENVSRNYGSEASDKLIKEFGLRGHGYD